MPLLIYLQVQVEVMLLILDIHLSGCSDLISNSNHSGGVLINSCWKQQPAGNQSFAGRIKKQRQKNSKKNSNKKSVKCGYN